MLKENATKILIEQTQKAFDEKEAKKLLDTFQISPSNNKQQALMSATKFFTVNGFVRPAIDYTLSWPHPSKVHLFAFNQGNPFPGPFQGCATHTVDALYQFQNVNDQFPSKGDVEIACDFATALVDFAHGRENIPAFGLEQNVKVWGPESKPGRVMSLKDDPLGLNKEIGVVRELGVLNVWGVMGGYLASP
jgi:hypothetical protein